MWFTRVALLVLLSVFALVVVGKEDEKTVEILTGVTEVDMIKEDEVAKHQVFNVTGVSEAKEANNGTEIRPRRKVKNDGILTYIAFGLALFISVTTLLYYAFPRLFSCCK
ncbi:hypothetical protein L596_026139 [Steinernema carpocapsae]|uniref:Uncharacterized protein n=1 Tax=Steinernema carpocapsae TaxID=34508 RepID=A0A4U5M0K6_STECR|nr:hypothetical protein L596_026139 [Steinernema carpocapsae]